MSVISFDKTHKGFTIGKFFDLRGNECSIQDSQSETSAVWLGIYTSMMGLYSERMFLDVDMATELRDALNRFIETGSIANETKPPEFDVYAIGLVYASICTDLSGDKIIDRMKSEFPEFNQRSTWKISDEPTFKTGEANPCECNAYPETHKHYLLTTTRESK